MTEEDLREVTAHRESYGKGYDEGFTAGQEAMLERCIDALGSLPDYPACCPCSIDRRRSRRHYSPHCEGWQDAMDRAESAIRALGVEP